MLKHKTLDFNDIEHIDDGDDNNGTTDLDRPNGNALILRVTTLMLLIIR